MQGSFKLLDDNQKNFIFKETETGDLKFVGDFEGLYLSTEDPWGQSGRDEKWRVYYKFSRDKIVGLLKKLEISGSALEVGCGAGFALDHIYSECNNIEVRGMDISYEAIRLAREQFPKIEFFQGDITSSSIIAGNKFEVIILNQILWYIVTSMEDAINNCLKQIDNDGYLIISQAFLREPQRFASDIINGFSGLIVFMQNYFPNLELVEKSYDGSDTFIHHDGIVVYRYK